MGVSMRRALASSGRHRTYGVPRNLTPHLSYSRVQGCNTKSFVQ